MRLVSLLTFGLLLGLPSSTMACATCGCGDPTLTVMGTEPPSAGRVRIAVRARYRWETFGARPDARTQIHEAALFLGASWAPTDRIVLSAELPFVLRSVRWPNLAEATVVGPSDAEVRGRVVLLRDRSFAPSHLLGVHAGARFGTSIDQVGLDGRRLPVEAQTGSGATAPLAGLFYAHLADPLALFASATVTLPLAPRFDEAPGPSLLVSLALQRRIDPHVSIRAGADLRLDAPATVAGQTDPRSDHLALFVSPELLWSPLSDVVIGLGVRLPVWQRSEQGRSEGPYVVTSVVVDL